MDQTPVELDVQTDEINDEKIGEDEQKWIDDMMKREEMKLTAAGVRPIPFNILNCGVVFGEETTNNGQETEMEKVINRVEFKSGFDFNRIGQIMTSDAMVQYPFKGGYCFTLVLLFVKGKENGMNPIIFPYIYNPTVSKIQNKTRKITNDLTEWLFINNGQQRTRMAISQYETVA